MWRVKNFNTYCIVIPAYFYQSFPIDQHCGEVSSKSESKGNSSVRTKSVSREERYWKTLWNNNVYRDACCHYCVLSFQPNTVCIQIMYRREVWSLRYIEKTTHTKFLSTGLSKGEIEEALRVSGTASDEVIPLLAIFFFFYIMLLSISQSKHCKLYGV